MDINSYKEKLQAEKTRLETQLSAAGNQSATTGDWQGSSDSAAPAIDPNEAADQIEELVSNTPIVESLESQLHEVNAALERIANGTYGVCTECGGQIPEERLAANPSASTCVACAA